MNELQSYNPEYEYDAIQQEIERLRWIDKERVEKSFIPNQPEAKPFFEQEAFFRSVTKTTLLRCGNRAAKTFTWVRDRAWKLMRNHPYNMNWNEDYEKSQPKVFWMVGPTFEFITKVIWEQYLKEMVPEWYYTNDNGQLMITWYEKDQIESVKFRNGDIIEFKTYSQNLGSKMGRAIDDLAVDEMPPKLMVLTELIVRCLDNNADATFAFTPIVENIEIKNYLDTHEGLELHSWSVLQNPVYYDAEKRDRLLSEYKHLSNEERETRLSGAWYFEPDDSDKYMQGVIPEVVTDFPIPHFWRRARIVDPASIRTGVAWFAEDPVSGIWYAYYAREIQWGKQAATADMLKAEINKDRPYPGFKYCLSLYDNHELWFAAHGPKEDWQPCISKNREIALVVARNLINTGKIKFFRKSALPLLQQMALVKHSVKYKDHMLDCLMYFCRQVPQAKKIENLGVEEHGAIYAAYCAQKEIERKRAEQQPKLRVTVSKFRPHVNRLQIRGVR